MINFALLLNNETTDIVHKPFTYVIKVSFLGLNRIEGHNFSWRRWN
jgi:hypothetical protein